MKYFLALFLLLLTACAGTKDPAEMYAGQSAEQIFQKGEDALRHKHYADAIKRFEALDAQYPYGSHIELAHLHVIYAYYETGDYASAESAANRFIHAHPVNPHVDYAYLMRGLSNFYQNLGLFERLFLVDLSERDLSQIKKAYGDFAQLILLYPQSRYAPMAHQYMLFLRNVLADHEFGVAEYYWSRKAYVAAANRANMVVQHYQGAPVVPKALQLMVKCYRAMHLTKLADDAERVYQYNFKTPSETAR